MRSLIVLVFILGTAVLCSAQTARKPPYDESANARTDIAKAVAAGQRDHKRILLVFGGNW